MVWEKETKQKGRMGNADTHRKTEEIVTQFWAQAGTFFMFLWAHKNKPTCF